MIYINTFDNNIKDVRCLAFFLEYAAQLTTYSCKNILKINPCKINNIKQLTSYSKNRAGSHGKQLVFICKPILYWTKYLN